MVDDDPQWDARLSQLERSLQALASSPSEQLQLFPEFATDPGGLASAFDRSISAVWSGDAVELSPGQVDALAAVDRTLKAIARDGSDLDLDLWSEAALRSSPHWDDVRRLAAAALEAFGWAQSAT